MPRRRPSQPTVFSTPSKSGIDLSVGMIKSASVPSATVRVGRRPRRCPCSRGVGAAEPARGRFPHFTGRCHTCPEFQACTLQRRRLERESEWKWGRERHRLLGEARGALKGPGEHTPPLTTGPVLDKWPSKVQGNLPR